MYLQERAERERRAIPRPRRLRKQRKTILTCLSRSPAIWTASGGLVRANASRDHRWTLLHPEVVNCACLLDCVTSTVTSNPPGPRPSSGGSAMDCERLRCGNGCGCCGLAGCRRGGSGCGYDCGPWSWSGCAPWTWIGSVAGRDRRTWTGSCACSRRAPWIWIGCDPYCGRAHPTLSGTPWSSIGSFPWTWIGCVRLTWTGCVPWTWNGCDGPSTSSGYAVWTLYRRVP